MKVNTIVWSKITGLGIYMYPHQIPVEPDTVCTVLRRNNNTISHMPFSDIYSYENVCWNCNFEVSSLEASTCPSCHWVKWPHCEEDGIIILDADDPDGWEETTGFYYKDFFDDYANQAYDYLGQGYPDDVEKCYTAILKHELKPIMVVDLDEDVVISLYIENVYSEIARDIISSINGQLTYSVYEVFDPDYYGGGSCIFCGGTTYGDTLCPSCANNVD